MDSFRTFVFMAGLFVQTAFSIVIILQWKTSVERISQLKSDLWKTEEAFRMYRELTSAVQSDTTKEGE